MKNQVVEMRDYVQIGLTALSKDNLKDALELVKRYENEQIKGILLNGISNICPDQDEFIERFNHLGYSNNEVTAEEIRTVLMKDIKSSIEKEIGIAAKKETSKPKENKNEQIKPLAERSKDELIKMIEKDSELELIVSKILSVDNMMEDLKDNKQFIEYMSNLISNTDETEADAMASMVDKVEAFYKDGIKFSKSDKEMMFKLKDILMDIVSVRLNSDKDFKEHTNSKYPTIEVGCIADLICDTTNDMYNELLNNMEFVEDSKEEVKIENTTSLEDTIAKQYENNTEVNKQINNQGPITKGLSDKPMIFRKLDDIVPEQQPQSTNYNPYAQVQPIMTPYTNVISVVEPVVYPVVEPVEINTIEEPVIKEEKPVEINDNTEPVVKEEKKEEPVKEENPVENTTKEESVIKEEKKEESVKENNKNKKSKNKNKKGANIKPITDRSNDSMIENVLDKLQEAKTVAAK